MKPYRIEGVIDYFSLYLPGWVACTIVAGVSFHLSTLTPLSPVLLAIVLGMGFTFVTNDFFGCRAGIDTFANQALKVAVTLMGAAISANTFLNLRLEMIILMSFAMVLTAAYIFYAARTLNASWRVALLTSIPVVICGPTAAVAVAAILPQHKNATKDLTITIICLTALTTGMMFTYPALAQYLGYSAQETGVLLAATIHSISGAVGAAVSVSLEVGNITVLTKLFRVSLLAPVIIAASLYIRYKMVAEGTPGKKPPIIPGFVIAFAALASLNTMGMIPEWLQNFLTTSATILFTLASSAIGLKSSLGKTFADGGRIFLLILSGTALGTVLIMAFIGISRG